MFFKEIVFAFTIPFTFADIVKTLVLVEHPLAAGFEKIYYHKLTGNAWFFTFLGFARFKFICFFFSVTFDTT